ncbi:MAG TPA: DEAD/DEAH box helicase [Acidimicrobiales bacterium]|nr:DEAD/DEAH box helicase [Acidimicrobiales bacterium]
MARTAGSTDRLVTPGPPTPAVGASTLHDFELDEFQVNAIDALDRGASVLVAAPTGSGKTVVAEYAVARALAEGGKAFYTTPIKALSNQKYADLARRHGNASVGLLTGDNAINGDAPIVVMTTEVLRNMIYAGSPALRGLRFVILDEVHYLQDAYRGPVWEEVIIHLPPDVKLVCLSATVSNAEEVAEWLTTVRGATALILEEKRPVELRNLYLAGDRSSERLQLLPTLVDGRPNPEADRLDSETTRARGYRKGRRPPRRFFTPRRPEVIDLLQEREMLPSLYFIFSRRGCQEAVTACLDAGLRLTSPDERTRIRAIAEERTASLTDDDLDVLDYDRWLAALEMGLAAHHAGMVPPFKETVEACFTEGLVKAVFATETLALGINMPARSVVIERLTKFGGEARAFLTPGEYTQLTGRAGRRGIDELGYALVLWSPFVTFEQVASLASSRTYALRSAFRPTYNMAANLVRRYEPADAHHLLNLSFAQFQADRAVVRLESRIERTADRLAALRAEAACELGDVAEYRRLLRAAGQQQSVHAVATANEIEYELSCLAPGAVIEVAGRRLAVLSVAFRKGGAVKVQAIDDAGDRTTLGAGSMNEPPAQLGSIELPVPYAPNNRAFQHQVADALRRARLGKRSGARGKDLRATQGYDNGGRGPRAEPPTPPIVPPGAEIDAVDAAGVDPAVAVTEHPVDGCPDRDRHVRALAHAARAEKELDDLRREVRSRTESLARRFDRVLQLLESWGYLDGWALTDRGKVLARTYHESDLLVAEAMSSGVLDDLDPSTVAGLVSCFTYEHRGPNAPPPPWFPSRLARERWNQIEQLAGELIRDENAAGLPAMRAPDPGFLALAHAWAAGEGLADVLDDEDLSGGDFVRNVKTLIDLLRQIGDVAPDPATARSARQAADALHRGVVAASSTLDDVYGDNGEVTPAGETPTAATADPAAGPHGGNGAPPGDSTGEGNGEGTPEPAAAVTTATVDEGEGEDDDGGDDGPPGAPAPPAPS